MEEYHENNAVVYLFTQCGTLSMGPDLLARLSVCVPGHEWTIIRHSDEPNQYGHKAHDHYTLRGARAICNIQGLAFMSMKRSMVFNYKSVILK